MRPTLIRLAALALCAVAPPVLAVCTTVKGSFDETQLVGSACLSPVGLCSVSQIRGELQGEARFTASSVTPNFESALTGLVFVTGDIVITGARLGPRSGNVYLKNGAVFRTVGAGDLSDVQVVVGGDGDFAGASGAVRVSGTLLNGSGTSRFEGTVCFPQ
jgi:hypothetical protein